MSVTNALIKTFNDRNIKIVLINNTNQTVKFRRGCVVGRVSSVVNMNIFIFTLVILLVVIIHILVMPYYSVNLGFSTKTY